MLEPPEDLRFDFHPAVPLVRALMTEYADQLGIDLCFQNFEAELAGLPGAYAEPSGCLLVAVVGDEVAGCGAFRPLEPGICEMKRLYLRAGYRGRGLGRAMACALMERAKASGYQFMRLDTLGSMTTAIALYRSLGFQQIEPYNASPFKECVFFEANLLA